MIEETDQKNNYPQIYLHPEQDVEEAVIARSRNPQTSGYLDDQYELTREFRQTQEYYFRIEDAEEVLHLQKMQRQSVPLVSGFSIPNEASQSFNCKMNQLIGSLDSLPKAGICPAEAETHGFHRMRDDQYDEKAALQAAYSSIEVEKLSSKFQNLKIDTKQIKFFPKRNQKPANESPSEMVQESMEEKKQKQQLTKKMRKMKIIDEEDL